MLHGSLYSPALCLGPNLALTFGPDFGPHPLPLAPNLYLLTKAPNFCLLVLTPNLYFAALTPYLYLQTLAPNFYLPVLANNFITSPCPDFAYIDLVFSICICIYGPGAQFVLSVWGPEFAFTLLLVVVVVAVVVVIVVVISLE